MPHHSGRHRASLYKLNKKQQKQFIRRMVLSVAVLEPLMTIPQLYDIWVMHKVAGISVLTWSLYAVSACIWLYYGLQLKDKPLIIASALWVFMEVPVVIGVLLYR